MKFQELINQNSLQNISINHLLYSVFQYIALVCNSQRSGWIALCNEKIATFAVGNEGMGECAAAGANSI